MQGRTLFLLYTNASIMKRLFPIVIIFIFLSHQLSGQWYYRHHRVTDPKYLTLEQYNFSEKKASNTILKGGIIAGAGCLTLVIAYITAEGFIPSTGSMLLGLAGIIAIPTGAVVFLSGVITESKVLKSRKEAFPETGYLKIQPALIYNNGKGICPGITFSLSF